MKFALSILAGCLLIASASCRKSADLPETACPGIKNVFASPSGWGIEPVEKPASPIQFGRPRFNPNDANEILFVLYNSKSVTQRLVKYNIASQNMTTLVDKYTGGGAWPEWTTSGWIYYQTGNGIWRVKSNGDSLGRFTIGNPPLQLDDIINKQGDRFTYPTTKGTVVLDINGVSYDTLPLGVSPGGWSYDNSKIFHEGYQLGKGESTFGFYDLRTRQHHLFPLMGTSVFSADWFPNSAQLVWSSIKGIYKVDTLGNTVKLTSDCANKIYYCPTVSPDGTRIIYQCDSQFVAENDTYFIDETLHIMNADGSNDHKIDINGK